MVNPTLLYGKHVSFFCSITHLFLFSQYCAILVYGDKLPLVVRCYSVIYMLKCTIY